MVIQNQSIDFSLLSAEDFNKDLVIKNAFTIIMKDDTSSFRIFCSIDSKSGLLSSGKIIGIRLADKLTDDYLYPDQSSQLFFDTRNQPRAKQYFVDIILKKQNAWIQPGKNNFQISFSTLP